MHSLCSIWSYRRWFRNFSRVFWQIPWIEIGRRSIDFGIISLLLFINIIRELHYSWGLELLSIRLIQLWRMFLKGSKLARSIRILSGPAAFLLFDFSRIEKHSSFVIRKFVVQVISLWVCRMLDILSFVNCSIVIRIPLWITSCGTMFLRLFPNWMPRRWCPSLQFTGVKMFCTPSIIFWFYSSCFCSFSCFSHSIRLPVCGIYLYSWMHSCFLRRGRIESDNNLWVEGNCSGCFSQNCS